MRNRTVQFLHKVYLGRYGSMYPVEHKLVYNTAYRRKEECGPGGTIVPYHTIIDTIPLCTAGRDYYSRLGTPFSSTEKGRRVCQ